MTLSLVMSHLACADEPSHPKSEAQRNIVRPAARAPAAALGEPRQFRRHSARPLTLPTMWCGPASPSMAAIPAAAATIPSGPWCISRAASSRCATSAPARPWVTAQRGPCAGPRASPSSRWAMPMGSSARCRPGMARTGLVVYFGSHAAPILGRVSMDVITLDVSEVPEEISAPRRVGRADRTECARARARRSRRHHRLRGPHQSRPARLPALYRRLASPWPKLRAPSSAKPAAR